MRGGNGPQSNNKQNNSRPGNDNQQNNNKRQRVDEPSAVNADLQKRIAALEDSLEQERADKQHDRAKMGFLQEKIRSVAERSKNRGSMLIRLLASLRRCEGANLAVKAAKDDLEAAEKELSDMLQQATVMMAEEERPSQPQQQQQLTAAAGPSSQPEAAAPPQQQQQDAGSVQGIIRIEGNGSAAVAAVGAGVQEAVDGSGGLNGEQQAGVRLPMTFKIKM